MTPQRPNHYAGDVHWIDHSLHSGPNSQKTFKYPHFAVILTSNNLLSRANYPFVAYVPMTSYKPEKHGVFNNGYGRYPQDVLLKTTQYSALDKDTIIDCGQVYTCDYECFNQFRFRLNPSDLKEVRKRLSVVLGYGL